MNRRGFLGRLLVAVGLGFLGAGKATGQAEIINDRIELYPETPAGWRISCVSWSQSTSYSGGKKRRSIKIGLTYDPVIRSDFKVTTDWKKWRGDILKPRTVIYDGDTFRLLPKADDIDLFTGQIRWFADMESV